MSTYSDLIPVNVLTGALGSGKTTLLKALLRAPRLTGTMVLVNELGEIGIDHHLVEHASESTLLLENGCVCCAMRDDLKTALKTLHSRRARGEIPRYERVVVEPRDRRPGPIAYTLLAEPVLQHHYRLGNVVTVVDAVNAAAQLDRFEESVKQVALADRLVVSKLDVAGPDALEALRSRLATLNPDAPIIAADSPALDPIDLLIADVMTGSRRAARRIAGCARPPTPRRRATATTSIPRKSRMLLHLRYGARLDRVRSVDVDAAAPPRRSRAADEGAAERSGVPGPVLINGVQHLVHPPAHLERWPDDDRRSRVVVISSGLDHEEIERSLHAFNAIANPAPTGAAANVPGFADTAPPLRGRARSPAGTGELSATPSPVRCARFRLKRTFPTASSSGNHRFR